MADFKDFMLEWFKAYHLSNMDDGRRGKWRDMRGKVYDIHPVTGNYVYLNDQRTGNQKSWADPKTGDLKTTLPEPPLTEDQWEYFYRTTRDTLRAINAKRKDLTRAAPDAPFPLDKWFGDKKFKAFSNLEVPVSIQPMLDRLTQVLKDSSIKIKLKNSMNFSSEYSLNDLLDDLEKKNYSEHPETLEYLNKILTLLSRWLFPTYYERSQISLDLQKKLYKAVMGRENYDSSNPSLAEEFNQKIEDIQRLLDPSEEKIDLDQLRQFKDPSVWQEILKALYAPDKEGKKSGFYNHFAKFGGHEITQYMDEIVSGNDYDKLTPKLASELNIRESFKEKVTDWRKEHLDRLTNRAARHIYVDGNAEPLVGAILKEKLVPQDGLIKFIEKKDAVIKRMGNTAAEKGAKFLFEALEYIKSSGKGDEMLNGALRNGSKVQAVAFEIMKYAIATNKVNDAKPALEALAVMRYDTLTSKHWDALHKAEKDIALFGDKGYSWNKDNPSMQIVTGALDGTIKLGLNALFWGGVVVRNVIQHGRGKINPANRTRLATALVKIKADSAKFKNLETARAEQAEIDREYDAAAAEMAADSKLYDDIEAIDYAIDELNALNTDIGQNAQDITSQKERIDQLKQDGQQNLEMMPYGIEQEENIYQELVAKQNQLTHAKNELAKKFKIRPGVSLDDHLKCESKRLKQEQEQHKDRHERLAALRTSWRVAHELTDRLAAADKKGHDKETSGKDYVPPKSAMENLEMLVSFWNAANGFNNDIDVNSYNIFRNIKDVRKQANRGNDFNKWFMAQGEHNGYE